MKLGARLRHAIALLFVCCNRGPVAVFEFVGGSGHCTVTVPEAFLSWARAVGIRIAPLGVTLRAVELLEAAGRPAPMPTWDGTMRLRRKKSAPE